MKKFASALAVALGVVVTVVGAGPAHALSHGCTADYWRNHTDNWEEHATLPISSDMTLEQAQYDPQDHPYTDTLLQALNYTGEAGLAGAEANLMREAAAAWLNAADDRMAYPWRRWEGTRPLIRTVNQTIYTQDVARIQSLADRLAWDNNRACPHD